jgi:thiamine kinase-like enzyme
MPGSTTEGPPLDYVLSRQPSLALFLTTAKLHDWLSWLTTLICGARDPWRSYLRDDATIVFSHADLHQDNIMISSTNPPKVIAILDWEQAGWYPEY